MFVATHKASPMESGNEGSPLSQMESGNKGSPLQDDDVYDNNDDDISPESSSSSTAQKVYVESNNSKKQLYLLCLSLKHNGESVLDLDVDPWKTMRKQEIKPSKVDYVKEVSQRAEILIIDKMKTPKAANWRATMCIQ
jgi:hypothetical protein